MTSSNSSFATSYEYAQSGTYDVNPDYKDIHPYVATVDRNTKQVDGAALNKLQVIGMMIEAGYLYDVSHILQSTYVSPKLDTQVKVAKEADISYGLFAYVRARNTQEATEELRWLRIYIQKYVPPLGVWLKLELANDSAMNDMIIAKYKDILERSGLTGKMGFYTTRTQLEKVDWDKWQEDFLLWLIDPVENISEIETILTPTFFDL